VAINIRIYKILPRVTRGKISAATMEKKTTQNKQNICKIEKENYF